uniref:Uncharacterized protein n=1 Tax=Arundo donax TaxID=35708 RepID=A0A0A9C671_ARUDO
MALLRRDRNYQKLLNTQMPARQMRNCRVRKRKMHPKKLKHLIDLWTFKMARLTHESQLKHHVERWVQREERMKLPAHLSLTKPCLEPRQILLTLIISLATSLMNLPMIQAQGRMWREIHLWRLMKRNLWLLQQMSEVYGLELYHGPEQLLARILLQASNADFSCTTCLGTTDNHSERRMLRN